MKTEDLLEMLEKDELREPRAGQVLWRWLIPALILSALAMAGILGVRFPMEKTLMTPEIAPKFYLPLLLGVIAMPIAVKFARPLARVRLSWAWVFPAIGLLLLGYAFVTTPESQRMMDFRGKTILPCLLSIPLFSAPILVAVLTSLRQGAVIAPQRAGVAAGLAAGGLGTAIYALHCTEDSPLFYVTWYGAGIAITVIAGALLGRVLLRW
ncbi:NrsF family protein [Thioclava pacifica]|uniref:DUF1109 domain-containing protein n=1 Tax=Thioclava pacifica DSM 10166 TaxID=1353537 RepID=A0A074JCQ8_9RHOB|nr:DUF1109 domain-containing protein [Thioclava pacifica]KEO54319.1 hypothetical protein TP2_05170 [Thioclava pacifica DSM 10166]